MVSGSVLRQPALTQEEVRYSLRGYEWSRIIDAIAELNQYSQRYSLFNQSCIRCCFSRVMYKRFVYQFRTKLRLSFRNPKVQSKGLNLGYVSYLLRLLNTETDTNMKVRLLFTLSTLVRNFPQAQINFVQHGGIETIVKMFDQNTANSKMKMRTFELMNDLITEKVR